MEKLPSAIDIKLAAEMFYRKNIRDQNVVLKIAQGTNSGTV